MTMKRSVFIMNGKQGVLWLAACLAACSTAPTTEKTNLPPAPVAEATSQPPPSSPPGSGGYLQGDGPGSDVPPHLDTIPDAQPRAEPIHRYANRPYEALGKSYVPLTTPGNYKERGIASWYGKKFNGQRTSIGEVYDMYAMTAAHPTLPIPSYARVTHLANKKSVVVRVNDRGPFLHNRIIDLSYTAAHKLGILGAGSGEVEVESLLPGATVAPVVPEAVRNEPLPAVSSAPGDASGIYLQLGAFKSRLGAEGFLARMRSEFEGSGKQVVLHAGDDQLSRVRLGPYETQDEARVAAEKLHDRLGFRPFVSGRSP